jgi:hypothetical protein
MTIKTVIHRLNQSKTKYLTICLDLPSKNSEKFLRRERLKTKPLSKKLSRSEPKAHDARSKNPIGIRRNLSVGFGRPLLLIRSFNKLVPGANFRDRSKPPIGSVEFRP